MSKVRANLKLLVIGSSGTGKTSFIQRWTKNEFLEDHRPSIVSEFAFKLFEYKEKQYRIQLWDIGGQDKSPSMMNIFAKDTYGCLVLTDCTDKSTLDDGLEWRNVMNEVSYFPDGKSIPFILIHNKIDLIQDKIELEEIENNIKNFSENNNFTNYFMTSVKENIKVDDAMKFLIENIIDRLEIYAGNGGEVFADQIKRETIRLRSEDFISVEEKKKNDCCK